MPVTHASLVTVEVVVIETVVVIVKEFVIVVIRSSSGTEVMTVVAVVALTLNTSLTHIIIMAILH